MLQQYSSNMQKIKIFHWLYGVLTGPGVWCIAYPVNAVSADKELLDWQSFYL